MAGQPLPPRLVEAFAKNAPTGTPASPIAGGKTSPFPSTSQVGIVNGAASLDDGFPPLTMTDPTSGGVPPFGCDMNGILFLLSSHIAALAAGQWYTWDSTLETDMGGYALGALLQQAADPTAFWINIVGGNTSNPDTGGAGWVSTKPLHASVSSGGNDIVLPGASDFIYDIDATASPLNISGFVARRDGQKLTLRKIDATGNAVNLQSLMGSAGANQLQIVAGFSLPVQYAAFTIMYSAAVGKWVGV